jgi:hypothetical protein
MKKLIYSALIGSLALAFSAQAADEKKAQKKAHAGHGPANVQRVQGKAGGPGQTKMHGNQNAMHVQRQAINRGHNQAAMVNQNKMRSNSAAALRHNNNMNAAAMQSDAVRAQRQNAKLARSQNAAVRAQQNVAVNPQQNVAVINQGNLKPNRHRNVAVVNNWSGSRYSGQQYTAFRDYRRQWHDRNWYTSRYNRFALFGGGNYYWDNGYWYPAWGYDSGYHYGYDGPIYGYNDLDPNQVVVNVQQQLQRDGYYDGPIDGLLGPMTRRALAAFQADQGLPVTSAIDQPTLQTLGLS